LSLLGGGGRGGCESGAAVASGEDGVGEEEEENVCCKGEEPRGEEGVSNEDLAASAKTEGDTNWGVGTVGESVAGLVL